jgi:prevent-host-death family protein
MDATITATAAARRFSDLLNRVRYRGERFVIERGGEPIADLVPHAGAARLATLSDLAALIRDGPRPDEGFLTDVAAIQADQPPMPDEPWPSS